MNASSLNVQFQVSTLSELENQILLLNKKLSAQHFFLEGPMGSGKTTFVQQFAPVELRAQLVSPTYGLIHEIENYLMADFYRLHDDQASIEQIVDLEISLYLEGKDYVFIEWGLPWLDLFNQVFPEPFQFYKLTISLTNDTNIRDYQLTALVRE